MKVPHISGGEVEVLMSETERDISEGRKDPATEGRDRPACPSRAERIKAEVRRLSRA